MRTATAKTLELAYDAAEDRILMLCLAEDGRRWTVALTRRLTGTLNGLIIRMLRETSPTTKRVPEPHRADAFQMEHERLSGGVRQEKVLPPEPAERRPGPRAPVVERVTLGLRGGEATLAFLDETGMQTLFLLPRDALHRFSAYLERQARRGDWHLPDPLAVPEPPELAPRRPN